MDSTLIATTALGVLRDAGIELVDGLAEAELQAAEASLGCSFPADLRLLLGLALPLGDQFPNWREPNGVGLLELIAQPIQGVLFEVRVNHFWMPNWPPRPTDFEASIKLASDLLARWPKLIPLFGHRYLPSEPNEPGNPVLSVVQTDIIYYGSNLADYFRNEFVHRGWPRKSECRPIPVWGYFVDDLEARPGPEELSEEFGQLSGRLHADGWSDRVTVERLIAGWEYLAATVGCYRATIDDYTNEVTGRDALEFVLGWASRSTRIAILGRVTPADQQFQSATVDDGGLAIGGFINLDRTRTQGWWWRRRPTTGQLGAYLDLK